MQDNEDRARECLREHMKDTLGCILTIDEAVQAMLAFNPQPGTLNPELEALISRNSVHGGFANTVAIAEEAFEMGKRAQADTPAPYPTTRLPGLIVRLRSWPGGAGDTLSSNTVSALMREAADEIAKLQVLAAASAVAADGEGDLGASGPLPRESAGREILIRATIIYPGSTVSDIRIGNLLPVQISNEALRCALSASPLPGREEIARVIEQARFLCDRLDALVFDEADEAARDYYGHVFPALSRLKGTLELLSTQPTDGDPK